MLIIKYMLSKINKLMWKTKKKQNSKRSKPVKV